MRISDWSSDVCSSDLGGVNVLTKYIATQYGKQNIRCNAVLPGVHLGEEALARTPEQSLKNLAEHCMLPRLGVPEDIAKAVAFLASDDAFYITAQLDRKSTRLNSSH